MGTLMLLVSHMAFTILANVKLKLTLNTCTTQEFTAMDIMDIFQRSTTLLPPPLSATTLTMVNITESTIDFTTPMLVSTISENEKLKLTLNTSTTPEFTAMDIMDTFQRSTTQLPLQSSTTTPTMEYTTESTMDFTTPMLVSTILASVMPKLTPNTFIVLEYTTMDTTDTSQKCTTVYTIAFTMEYTTDFTIPTLMSTILASVTLKLILNGCLIMDILHTPAILDTLDSPDTPLPTTMALSGTVLNTCGKNEIENENFTF